MQNFLSGRKKIATEAAPKEAFEIATDNPNTPKIEVAHASAGEPKIELKTEAGQIREIIITCKCGERIELKCHY